MQCAFTAPIDWVRGQTLIFFPTGNSHIQISTTRCNRSHNPSQKIRTTLTHDSSLSHAHARVQSEVMTITNEEQLPLVSQTISLGDPRGTDRCPVVI